MSHVVMSQFGAKIEFRCLGLGVTMLWSRRQFWAQKSLVSMFVYLGFGLLLGFVFWCLVNENYSSTLVTIKNHSLAGHMFMVMC
jgi:hypothetical protein